MNLALLTTIGHFGLALLPIAALIAVGYSLRVAWANNLTLFGEDIDSWLDAIQDSFAWFSDTVLGEMGKSFVDTFALTFKLIKQNSNEFLSNLFASFTGAFTWLKAIKEGIENGWKSITFDGMFKEFKRGYENANKDWAESFADAVRKNDKEIEKMVKFTKEAFKKVENTSKGFIIAVDKQAEEVGEAFKTQFTKDIDSMIKTLRSKLPIIENLMESLDFNSTDDDASNRLLNSLKKQAEDTIKMLESVGNAAVKTAKKTDEAGKQFTDKAIARFAEFQQSLTSIMEQGLMNMVEDWKSWKDTVISMLREVYFEAVRIAFITPAAKASAQGLTDAGKYIFKAFNIGLTSTGTSSDFGVTGGQIGPAEAPGLASGGTVERTGWAMVHKGEEFSGVGKTLGGNGNLNFKLHYEGQPLVVSKQQSFIQNEQQFAEVWLALADTNQAVRSKVKGLK